MKWTHWSWIIVILLLLFIPAPCFAYTVMPLSPSLRTAGRVVILSFFCPFILVEAFILKCFLWDYSYLRHLYFVLYPSIISSLVGSILFYMTCGIVLLASAQEPTPTLFFPALLLFSFFLLAVVVKFPVVWYLYSKRIRTSRALLISFVMNFASYSLLMILVKYW
jgi:hypothetical protein